MRLLSLTLFGFKSFPVRTKFSFPRGISAIVGPNGCGKSNVVDAIRWVLGEQSPSMLRARSMDEMMFSGGNGRQINMAEVRLTVENSGSVTIPELGDAPELEIMRRIHRSGQTEYMINGKTCRLKDIHYLFMDTGAGTRAYSIVDQGQIGAYVDMGPMERRVLLEEVAGVSRYKARRGETQRRMIQTEQNLERLEDVMMEVDRQRRGLAKQARKAEQYLAVRTEQELLDKALLAYAWGEESSRCRELSEEGQAFAVAAAEVRARLGRAAARVEDVELEILGLDDEMERQRRDVSAAGAGLQELRDRQAAEERLLIVDENELRTAEARLARLEQKESDAAGQGEVLAAVLRSLETEAADLAREVAAGEEGLAKAEEERDRGRSRLEAFKVTLVDVAARCASLDSKRRGLGESRRRLVQRIEQKERELLEIAELAVGLGEDLAQLEELIERSQSRLDRVEQEAAGEGEALRLLEERHEEAKRGRLDVEGRLTRCKERLKVLEALDAAGEGCSRATRMLLDSEVRTLGIVADFLDVAPGWERAVEVALGSRVQAVVVRDRVALGRALEFLKVNRAGQASIILPGEGVGGDKILPEDALLARVRARPPLDGVLASMIGAHRIVSDLSAAFLVSPEDREGVYSVTAQGELLTPWGEVLVQGQEDQSTGILARKGEIGRLHGRVEELEAVAGESRRFELGIEDAMNTGREKVRALLVEKDALTSGLLKEKEERERARSRRDSRQERAERLGFEIAEAREEVLEMEISLEEIDVAIESANSAKGEAEGRISDLEEALRGQEQGLAARRKSLEQQRVARAGIEVRLRGTEQEIGRLHKLIAGLREEKANALETRREFQGRVAVRRGLLAEARAKVDAQEREASGVAELLAGLRARYDERRQILAGLQGDVKELQAHLRVAEERIHQNEIALTEVRQGLEFIRRTGRERHQVDIEDACPAWTITPFDIEEARKRLARMDVKIRSMGPVNLGAVEEYRELEERWVFLSGQKGDLMRSMDDIRQAIDRINRTCRQRFRDALQAVNTSLAEVFPLLFEGGSAELALTGSDDVLDAGVDYLVSLPGKRIRYLNLLSGGEKAMAALALIFAIYLIKPSPFCLLDEVDAPLDEANTARFNRLIRKIAEHSQVVLITHDQRVMEVADSLYGVTMEERGVSKLVSVDLVAR